MPLEALIFDVMGPSETGGARRQSFNEASRSSVSIRSGTRRFLANSCRSPAAKSVFGLSRSSNPHGGEADLAHLRGVRRRSARCPALDASGAAHARPGVRRLIVEAHERGVRLAIATTSLFGSVEAVLRAILAKRSLPVRGDRRRRCCGHQETRARRLSLRS